MDYLEQRIKEIEEEIAKTPKNKGTEKHLSKLKSKLAILKEQLQKKKTKSSGKPAYQFAVKKEGDATVAMVGYPSVGKSSLLNLLTNAESEVADYAFTTLNVVPGIMEYRGAKIQLLDLPGIIEGASYGKGRGREVLSAARNADLIMIVSDVDNYEKHFPQIEKELYEAGFRLNKQPPEVKITKKDRGGLIIKIAPSIPINEKDVKELATDFNLHNAEIIITRAESLEDIADALIGNRKYVKAIHVVNKSDKLKTLPSSPYIFISVHTGQGIEKLKQEIWEKLELIRIYTKKPGEKPDLDHPLIMKKNSHIQDIKEKLKIKGEIKYARVWGESVKFPGQKVGKDHIVKDKDIVEIITD
ncbi:MAG: GTP-binding protein [Candidatus Nanohaloarchaeota archaeon]|nr:GTP-binding protein [Candidatus Nanohaloarchaeota archaeon]